MPRQQQLFDTAPEPWELDAQDERLVATVVFAEGPDGEFDYLVPEPLRETLAVGCRVRVPLGRGNRHRDGYCVALSEKPSTRHKLKEVAEQLDARSLLSPAMLRLCHWIAEHYLCGWGEVLEAVLPAGVRSAKGTRTMQLLSPAPELLGEGPDAAAATPPTAGTPAAPAAKASMVRDRRIDQLDVTPKQKQVLRVLMGAEAPLSKAELARLAKCSFAPIDALRRKKLILAKAARVHDHRPREEPAIAGTTESPPRLNGDQRNALETILRSIRAAEHQTILLHGVTGSGKTEVYIRAIEEVVSYGRQAIVLVPEISLTPQTVERFRARFGRVAVLHSHLSDADRHYHWQRIAQGQVPVVVGARSAVFAPTPHLGLIVLDEEHEGSFKQDSVPRYHAREVALRRADAEGVPLVLGSATPSLDSWHRAARGEYRLVEMPRRVLDRPLPDVRLIDLRAEMRSRFTQGAISRPLQRAIESALNDGGQVILLLNRRGFSTHIQCPACGHAVRCPDCDIALTHHRAREVALCHYCDHEIPAPNCCPECGFQGIRYGGLGTQRLEAEVRRRFPGTSCLRMDTDTMQGRGAHERALSAFRSGEVRILLGTQMIAKGLDFPNVTLVGVINADTALHLPDFRAAERTFFLVTQVAGRTGRGSRGGRVLVQTFSPDHPALQAASRHAYGTFADTELPVRQMLGYPPCASMIRLVIRGPNEHATQQFAEGLAERMRAALEEHGATTPATTRCSSAEDPHPGSLPEGEGAGVDAAGSIEASPYPQRADSPETSPCRGNEPSWRLLGPAPAPFARLRGKFRFQIHLQGPDGEQLRRAVATAREGINPPEGVQWIADVDPLDML